MWSRARSYAGARQEKTRNGAEIFARRNLARRRAGMPGPRRRKSTSESAEFFDAQARRNVRFRRTGAASSVMRNKDARAQARRRSAAFRKPVPYALSPLRLEKRWEIRPAPRSNHHFRQKKKVDNKFYQWYNIVMS